ncbi:class I SAM-dependent methyltransferase [Candidatus Ferrigenium straubiae]|jgi:ubiquinone/menaquinone biosynthesis C-methylase UbiE|uniref:class I SAM-dependent methyltransferase n=1 Tax=Candidatus Ferrigenium straubiae TaxID=2919506 RepID=UPI003F4AB8A2
MKKDGQPYLANSLLRYSYNLIAPLYDLVIERPLLKARTESLRSLAADTPGRVLVSGAGTGLDLPLLPSAHRYTALDFSAAMLSRARPRGANLQIDWVLGDSMALPFADAQFDHVVLHLILAVVPYPEKCLGEAARVLKPGGTILVFDKFLRPRQHAWLRRALNPLTRRLATRIDVVFEEVLREVPQLQVLSDMPLLAGGWFRGIVLRRV